MHSSFDTHCHLNYLKQASVSEIVQQSLEVGVKKMVCIATEPDNLDTVLKLTQDYPDTIYCSQGVHPHDADKYDEKVALHISKNISSSNKVVAIGEIGLDYHYNLSARAPQRKAFEAQLQLAIDHELPVIVHTRNAEDDTWAILKNVSSSLKKPLVLHSFTSSLDLAEKCLGESFFIGINGIVTFKNAQNVREVLDIIPIQQMLIETDAPFLTPMPHRGKENAPFYLPHVGEYICKHREWDLEESMRQFYQNSLDFFSIS